MLKYVTAVKKTSLLMAVLLCLSFFASCGGGNGGQSELSADDSQSSETSEQDKDTGITVEADGVVFKVDAVNTNRIDDGMDVVLYDRSYTENGSYGLYVPGDNTQRYILIVKRSVSGTVESFTVLDKYEAASVKDGIYIPVNGFTLSIDASLINDDFKVRAGQKVNISGYDDKPSYERFDLTTVIPDDKTKARRVNMSVPESMAFADDKIYYISKNDTVTVPENAVAIILDTSSGSNFSITSVTETGKTVSGTYALLFTGEFNVMYANEFYKEGKVYFTKLDELNGITDTAAVKIGATYYTFDEDHINTASGTEGIYLYTTENASIITDDRGSFIDVVVADGKVCYVGAEDTRTLIPTSHGFVISFAGNAKNIGKELEMGDTIENLLIKDFQSSDRFVRINGIEYGFTAVNEILSASDTVVLYTNIYGSATKNGADCVEITISDGKVISVGTDGSTDIPENGYVLAVSYSDSKLYNNAKNITQGASALVSFAGNNYGFSSFSYTAVNGVRSTDYIVIYDGKAGKTTGTNMYGYEVAVNSEGKMISSDYAGNMSIPENGYVISVHGDANMKMLKELYNPGSSVSLDASTKTVSVYKTPDLAVFSAAIALEEQKSAFEYAKKQFYSIDYAEISVSLDIAEAVLDDAQNAYNTGDMGKAVELACSISPVLEKLRFYMYESLPVENRAVWYRASEKSDEDVYNTVRLMAEMNINAVYIETWYNGKVIGYSDIDLIQHHTYAHGDYDALEGFCRIAHEYGIEIHIWVENFFIGVTGGELVNATEGHHLLDKKGRNYYPNMYGDFVFLNPYEEFSQNLVMSVYREIVENYDIDGIHLDYIRFPDPNSNDGADFGYNDDIIAGFQEAYNTTVNPKTMATSGTNWNNWCLFREQIINDWVAEVYTMAKELNPGLKITSAVSSNYPACRQTIFQNFNAWVEDGYMDEVFSMSYCANLEMPAANIITFTNYTDGKCFYSIGLSAFEKSPDYILAGQVQVARDSGAFGQNLFSWGSLISHEENYFDALKAGIYSKKSVQTDKLSLTVAAYASRLLENADNAYAYLAPEQEQFLTDIKGKVSVILNDAEAFDLDNSTNEQKIAYCEAAIAALAELKDRMNTCSNGDLAAKMTFDVSFILDCLSTSLVRISK
ncbi:MAG: family 10 glycosylhydrolase [Eubacteriales bacterium]|nr:family 10 glycosylhydrolase [Eubacteriales bacterium]